MNDDKTVALVTGASSGIGRAAAQALAAAGFTVIGTTRKPATAPVIAGVTFVTLDVTSDDSVASAVDEVLGRFGHLDVVVNNAGVGLLAAAEESSAEQAAAVFDVNVLGALRVTRAVLPHMRARGVGRIINVSSVLGLIPAPFMAVYAASKHAIEGYSESLDHELRGMGVRVLLVEPGYTSTGFEANGLSPDSPRAVYDAQRAVAADVLSEAMKRADDPSAVARAVVRAATDAKPRLRYPAGPLAKRVSLLRRLAPRRAFDGQIRKLNRLG